MDEKFCRRGKSEVNRRSKLIKGYRNTFRQFLHTSKKELLTGTLLLLMVALLFAIANQLPPPAPSAAPDSSETAIDYSVFTQQVAAGNVQAVVLHDQQIDVLLAKPLTTPSSASPAPMSDADYTAWRHYLSGGNTLWASGKTQPPLDTQRLASTLLPTHGDSTLLPLLLQHHVRVSTQPVSSPAGWLSWVLKFLPLALLVALLLLWMGARNPDRLSRSIDERVSQLGQSRVRRFERAKELSTTPGPAAPASKKPTSAITRGAVSKPVTARVNVPPAVTFADVAGINEVRTELEEIVQFLRSPERFNRLGAHIPRGALLVGPPGTGKTLLARAVAGEAGVPFFSISASEFVEMFVGVGASRVRDLFNQARQSSPCVIFIDEIDAVGRKRSMRVNNNDERDQTLNQLLVELDGFDPRKAVVVLAATNRVDILDKALLRPGRFDRRITVSPPDRAGREAILQVHTRKTPLHEDVSLARLASMSTGMTGADLANLVNEAALSAARRNLDAVTHECFEEALARIQLGALRPIVMSEQERRIIAYHEGGHALVAHYLPQADTVNRVTILPRGQSLGVTQFTAEEDRYNYSRETLMARIAVGLGGRVAEELTFGSERVTTGAENDFQVVTDLARRMVTRWGMSEQIGVVFADYRAEGDYSLNMRRLDPDAVPSHARSLVATPDGRLLLNGQPSASHHAFAMVASPSQGTSSAMLSALIDAEVQRILNEGYTLARSILSEHSTQLTLLASALIEHEQLDRAQFERLLKDNAAC